MSNPYQEYDTMEYDQQFDEYPQYEVLDRDIEQAAQEVTLDRDNAPQNAADVSSQLGFLAAVKEAASPHLKEILNIQLKDFKATAAGALAAVPLLGEGQAAAIVGRNFRELKSLSVQDLQDLADAARLEGASKLRASFEVGKIVPALTIESITAIRTAQHAPTEGVIKADKALHEATKLSKRLDKMRKKLEKATKKLEILQQTAETSQQTIADATTDVKKIAESIRQTEESLRLQRLALDIAKKTEGLSKIISDADSAEQALIHAQEFASTQLTPKQQAVFAEAMSANVPIEKALHYALEGFSPEGKSIPAKILHKGKGLVKGNVGKVIHALDPTPDVPGVVSLATWGAEMLGLHGAGIVPAVWQLAKNRVDYVKESSDLAKDVGTVVIDRAKQKIADLKDQKVEQAAQAFA